MRFARKNRIDDESLLAAIESADQGKVDAALAGCLIKLRISRPNQGKSGGYRSIVAYRTREKAFFLYGFAKNVRANISDEEREALEAYGELLLSLDKVGVRKLISDGKIREIRNAEK